MIKKNKVQIVICLILAAVTLGIFWQVREHDFINYDDDSYITENPQVKAGLTRESVVWAFTTDHAANWHPVTWLSHLVDVELYGLKPGGHHLTNLFLHIASAILLFLLLVRMTSDLWQSAFVAALFAIHPLHVESVAWVAERKDVLSGLFWMLTLLLYARYVERPGPLRYVLTLLVFALGLMSKPMLVTLPCVFLLLDYWPLRRMRRSGGEAGAAEVAGRQQSILNLVKEKIPFFALAVIASVVTVYAQQKGGAVVSAQNLSLPFRIANALLSYFHYIRMMIWPHDLAIIYPINPDLNYWQGAGAGLLLAVVTLWALYNARRYPFLIVGWLWYLGTLVPVIGLIQVGQQSMADRYTYLPLIGLFMMIAWGVPSVLKNRRSEVVLAVVGLAVLFSLAVSTWQHLGTWKNSITLFSHAVSAVPGNYVALSGLGNSLRIKGQAEEAIACYKEALRIKPDYYEAHSGLGFALAAHGRFEEAIHQYEEALRINPRSGNIYNNLGIALAEQGRADEAIASYRRAVQLEPANYDAQVNLGDALINIGRSEEAIYHYTEALVIDPGSAEAHYALGMAYGTAGKLNDAVHQFHEALRLKPGFAEAHYNLGVAFAKQGAFEEAKRHFIQALQINSELKEAKSALEALQTKKRSLPK